MHNTWTNNLVSTQVSSSSINGFDGNNFHHSTWQQEDSSPSNSFDYHAHNAQVSSSNNRDKWLNNNTPQQQTNGTLTMELTPSILQLRELNLKCQTRVEQPLIEFEHQVVLQVPPTQFIQSNPRANRPYQKNHIAKWNSNSGYPSPGKNRVQPSSGCAGCHLIASSPVVVILVSWSVSAHIFIYRLWYLIKVKSPIDSRTTATTVYCNGSPFHSVSE